MLADRVSGFLLTSMVSLTAMALVPPDGATYDDAGVPNPTAAVVLALQPSSDLLVVQAPALDSDIVTESPPAVDPAMVYTPPDLEARFAPVPLEATLARFDPAVLDQLAACWTGPDSWAPVTYDFALVVAGGRAHYELGATNENVDPAARACLTASLGTFWVWAGLPDASYPRGVHFTIAHELAEAHRARVAATR